MLLHGCCHNPTGADLDDAQWAEVVRVVAERGLLPFVDIAYQGLGRGLEEDARGLHLLLDACDEVIVAHSCDKNFGLYRDRVGSLWIKTASEATSKVALDHVLQISREMWSMPPDHGAAAVRIVLEDAGADRRLEGRAWRHARAHRAGPREDRRRRPAAGLYRRSSSACSRCCRSTSTQVRALRTDHAIYMADSGRFNVLGMADACARPLHRRDHRGDEWLRRTRRWRRRIDWSEVARLVTTSRALDHLEETRLVPEKKVLYQFSARGHDMAQVILGLHLRDGDAACGYYRSRPMLLALGRAAGRCARLGDGPRRGLFGRARYRRGVQLPQSGRLRTRCRCAAGSGRNMPPRRAGRSRCSTRSACLARPRAARSGWCSAATRAARRADSGRR